MKATLLFVLLCVGLAVATEELYIDAAADGTSTTCTDDAPCNSVQAALTAFGTSTDALTLFVAPGDYTGDQNVGITFPAVEVEIKLNGDGDVNFNCNADNSTAFTATTEFTVSSINFWNCGMGIVINSDADLSLEDTTFTSVNNAIVFSGEDITLSNVVINGTQTGLSVTNATSFTMDSSTFMAATVASIDYTSTATEKIDLESTTFTNTAGVSFTVAENDEDFEGIIDGCDFANINTGVAIELNNGAWDLGNFNISTCSTAVSYMSAGSNYTELDMDDIDIVSCTNGVSFSAPGSLDIDGGSISVTNQAISITSITHLVVDGPIAISNAATPIAVDVTEGVNAAISDVTFNNTGSVMFNVADCNCTISDSTFTYLSDRALDITGGMWGINNLNVTGPVTADEGAAFRLVDATSFDIVDCDITLAVATNNGGAVYVANATVGFDTCTFTNCSAVYGGAIYASNFPAFSIEESTFENNVASANGGGIDVEASSTSTNNATEVHVKDVTFTSNSAITGAAISCCNLDTCNITIAEDSSDTITLSNNMNSATDGTDITCGTEVTPFTSAAEQPEVSYESSSSDWLFWLVISLAILLVVGLIVAAGVGVYFYRKRMSYSVVE